MRLTKGIIDLGHFWYTNFWVSDPPLPPSSLPITSLVDVFGSILAALTAAARAEGTQPPQPSSNRGSRVLQGVLCCRHRGSQRLLLWVRGVRGRARVRDRVVHLSPRRGAASPPSLPPLGGQGRHRCAAMRQGRAGQQAGQTVSGAPRSTGARQLVCRPAGGGLLSLGFTRQVQPSGGGDTQPPHSRACGRGRGSAQPEIWAGSLLGGSHVGGRPRSFCCAAICWGGQGG